MGNKYKGGYFRLGSFCRVVGFKGDLILLELKQNRYTVLNKTTHRYIIKIMTQRWTQKKKQLYSTKTSQPMDDTEKAYYNFFIASNIIDKKLHSSPEILNYGQDLVGANLDWRLPEGGFNKDLRKRDILKAFWYLSLIHLVEFFNGFKGLVNYIRHNKKKPDILECNLDHLRRIADSINKASIYFPKKVKCLEWASCLTLMGLKSNLKCKLLVGVQTKPFYAHAWVQGEEMVIYDDPNLPKQTAIILQEPE